MNQGQIARAYVDNGRAKFQWEPVIVQAIHGGDVLVTFLNRRRIQGRTFDCGYRRKAIQPWAWLPAYRVEPVFA